MSQKPVINGELASTSFGKINVALQHTLNAWVLTDDFVAGDLAVNNGIIYVANDVIPASTAFVEGTTGATWKQYILSDVSQKGWEMVQDTQYTQGVPLVVTNGSRVKLTNNGLGTLTSTTQLPAGITELYNLATDTIVPVTVGDLLNYRITLQVTPSNANVVGILDIQIEDDPVVVTGTQTITFPDSAERQVHLYTSQFVIQNFIDNKASIYLQSDGGTLSIYDYRLLIERAYIGK